MEQLVAALERACAVFEVLELLTEARTLASALTTMCCTCRTRQTMQPTQKQPQLLWHFATHKHL